MNFINYFYTVFISGLHQVSNDKYTIIYNIVFQKENNECKDTII